MKERKKRNSIRFIVVLLVTSVKLSDDKSDGAR